jgi:Fe-S-cluster containining protein
MRLQILDNEIRYECGSCAECCRQPWLEAIEPEKLAAIQSFDWAAKYPQLAGREPVSQALLDGRRVPVVSKKDNGECLFLDDDNLCIIHKELGYEAKPQICRRFPHYSASMPDADRISANFGCPSVQSGQGPSMEEKREDILNTLPPSKHPAGRSTDVALMIGHLIPLEAASALADRWADLFHPNESSDLWERFARALRITIAATKAEPDSLRDALDDEQLGADLELPPLQAVDSWQAMSVQTRMLLALTLWNDYYPPGHSGTRRPTMGARLGLVGKVMHVARMKGAYASRHLPGNIAVHHLNTPRLRSARLAEKSVQLLCRWIRAKFRQRSFRRDRISMMAGLHQQIIDTNAVHFYARASAIEGGRDAPSHADYSRALKIVDFGISFQARAYSKFFKKQAMAMLESPVFAWESLCMFHPQIAEDQVPATTEAEHTPTYQNA